MRMLSAINIQMAGDMPVEGSSLTMSRIAAIIRKRIEDRCPAKAAASNEDAPFSLKLALSEAMEADAYRIEAHGEEQAAITAGSPSGLLYGAGKWLHTSCFEEEGLIPSAWRGESKPESAFRGIYFATHFFNYYHVAPLEELTVYLEDLALWGTNHLLLVFPFVNLDGWEDPNTKAGIAQLKRIYSVAKQLDIKIGIGFASNNQFRNAPASIRAMPNVDPLGRKGNHGVNICTSKPEGKAYILSNIAEMCRRFTDVQLDFIVQSPYDEGGCGCERCHPWGAEAYLTLAEAIVKTARDYFPGIAHVLSTWVYDTPEAGEWEALRAKLADGNDWVNYIMADAHENYPEYPLKHGIPGGVPLINFPEISMWGLSPWGGFGANPLPDRFDRLWSQIKHTVQGGFPYSEGIYEDINKVIVSQFYWHRQSTAEQTLRDYIGYEFSHRVADQALRMIRIIERNHTLAADGQAGNAAEADMAWSLAQEIDAALQPAARRAWRWRILYLRAQLDAIRYRLAAKKPDWINAPGASWGTLLENHDAAQAAFRELITIYHSKLVDDGSHKDHSWIRPPMANKAKGI